MRKRFRGNYTVVITEGKDGQPETQTGGQMYAGKPAFSDPVPAGGK